MKIKLFAIAAGLMLLSFVAEAQAPKIGYVKLEALFTLWPDAKQSDTELKEFEANLGRQIQAKERDFQAKYQSYQQNVGSMNDLERKDVEAELQSMQTRMQSFAANAQESVTKKNQALVVPLQKKLKETIDQVAKENGFTHIFTFGSSLIFTTDAAGDISPKVAQKLGFTFSEPQ